MAEKAANRSAERLLASKPGMRQILHVDRAFAAIYAVSVERSALFYEQFGFQRHFQLPPEGEAGYIGLKRGAWEFAIVSKDWPLEPVSIGYG